MRKNICAVLILLPLILATQASGQSRPVNRKIQPVSGQVIKDTVPDNTSLINPKLNKKVIEAAAASYNQPNLFLIKEKPAEPEVYPRVPPVFYYIDDEAVYEASKVKDPNWQYNFIWTNIPAAATQARFEISSLPFPPLDANFKGAKETRIIQKLRTRVIGKKQADTVWFNISFTDPILRLNPKLFDVSNTKQEGNQSANTIKSQDRSVVRQVNRTGRVNTSKVSNQNFTLNEGSLKLLSDQSGYGYYFVRLIALDAAGNPVGRIGNTIKIIPHFFEPFKQPVPSSEDSLQSDYEITAINYVRMHEPEQQFENCVVITGYSSPSLMQAAYPVGSTMCPSPPEKPSAFEKVFSTVSSALSAASLATKIIVEGSAKVFNDTKNSVKVMIGKYLCDNTGVDVVKAMDNNGGVATAAIDAGCAAIADTTFDVAMSYYGMPPTIPNFDEMYKLAKGQVVELMVQKASEYSGKTCNETNKQSILQAYDQIVNESVKKNIQSDGLSFKPDPRGQYQMPYVEIEISRKRQTQKGAPIITNLYFTPQVEKHFKDLYDKDNRKNYSVDIKTDKLYQQVMMPIPYLKNVGDKIKLIVVLTPKRSYFSYRCPNGAIDGIENYQQHCEGLNVMQAEMGDPRFSLGYSAMVDNATITIKPEGKIVLAPGVQTRFVHHQ